MGLTKAGKPGVDLAPAVERPMHLAAYRASSRTREFEKHEIDKMLALEVIDQSKPERVAPIIFLPRETELSNFVWTTACSMQ